ncbi:hypothetical protein JCM33374_g1928 [Metschnikowia sp. JCM 33374]|nr:hypothetical protein JCM33374_g1928 [Metschnikowia sp. JCM 33374]
MSQTPPFAVPTSAGKRRRVLSEIGNTEEAKSPGKSRRTSLGFDLVRIPTSPKQNRPNPPKSSPKAMETVSSAMPRPTALADMNIRGSAIPTLKKTDRFERFLTINESLNRKSTINGHGSDSLASAIDRAELKQQSSKPALEKLLGESKRLDHELQKASRKLSYSQEEAFATRKLQRALQNEHNTLKVAVEEQVGKFEFLSAQVTARVEKIERGVEVKIEEHRRKAQSTYDGVRDEIKAELEHALRLGDEESAKELASLKAQKTQLEEELKKAIASNEAKISAQKLDSQNQVDAVAKELDGRVMAAESSRRELQLEEAAIDEENLALETAISEQKLANQKAKDDISALERTIQGYVLSKSDFDARIFQQNDALGAQKAHENDWACKEASARAVYMEEKQKYHKYTCTRRRLEHAIAKLSEKHRVFVRVKASPDHLSLLKQAFDFDKLTSYTPECSPECYPECSPECSPESTPDHPYSLEWELLAKESLTGSQVSLLFVGSPQRGINQQLVDIFSFLMSGHDHMTPRGWTYTVYFQSILVQDDTGAACDLLNSSSEVEFLSTKDRTSIVSQKMLVKNAGEVSSILRNKQRTPGVYIHAYTVEGVNVAESQKISGMVMVGDVSSLAWHQQKQLLTGESRCGGLDEMFGRSSLNHTCIDICDMEDIQDPGAQELLAVLHQRACQK